MLGHKSLKKEKYSSIGLMSGTSCDGVDVALIDTDGERQLHLGPMMTIPYDKTIYGAIKNISMASFYIEQYMQLKKDITIFHADAVLQFLAKNNINKKEISFLGFHGHTLKHLPAQNMTLQIGDPNLLATLCDIDVIDDFRSKDIALGGQGAPLVPIFLKAITQAKNLKLPVVFLNIGGVANLTYVEGDYMIAYDVAPGNAMIDDLVRHKSEMLFDKGGEIAFRGEANELFINTMMADDYFQMKAPKSLDRDHFKNQEIEQMNFDDGVATLSEFTARSISRSINALPKTPHAIMVYGGGMHNKYFIKRIAKLTKIEILQTDHIGVPGDFLESYAFGYLAVRSARDLPITFSTTTATKHDASGGRLCLKASVF